MANATTLNLHVYASRWLAQFAKLFRNAPVPKDEQFRLTKNKYRKKDASETEASGNYDCDQLSTDTMCVAICSWTITCAWSTLYPYRESGDLNDASWSRFGYKFDQELAHYICCIKLLWLILLPADGGESNWFMKNELESLDVQTFFAGGWKVGNRWISAAEFRRGNSAAGEKYFWQWLYMGFCICKTESLGWRWPRSEGLCLVSNV